MPVGELRVVFSLGGAASDLWAFGEDDLAEAALAMSDDQLIAAWRIAATYYDETWPLPVTGRRITLGHVVAFATMAVLEGDVRPLARQRRRPKSSTPERIKIAADTPIGLLEMHQMFGDNV